MDSKLFARIGAGTFVAVALTMTVLGLREEPELPSTEFSNDGVPDGDPLPATLRACSAMGEQALSSPDCRAASPILKCDAVVCPVMTKLLSSAAA